MGEGDEIERASDDQRGERGNKCKCSWSAYSGALRTGTSSSTHADDNDNPTDCCQLN